jgi:hypothetical protein
VEQGAGGNNGRGLSTRVLSAMPNGPGCLETLAAELDDMRHHDNLIFIAFVIALGALPVGLLVGPIFLK